ncbi:TraB/GumN family protein [Erythrobacter sp. GH1-10]|uniref:TraB/GumN family protein n=1 Tax=Erythrobacter sp. GH1-10 TaxID=3349334 RepID=UPI003877E636
MTGTRQRASILGFGALALASCSDAPDDPQPLPDPPVYEIVGADGAVEGWMLGTIHALPKGTGWRNPAIDKAIADADYLIVEIADLEDREAMAKAFSDLASTPGQPAIANRVGPEWRPALADAIARSDYSPDDFGSTETWAAALMLARVAATGDPASGVDRAIIREFSDREVREFEGAIDQLRVFDTLKEEDQQDLLEGVLAEIETSREEPGRLREAWLAGDEATLEEATRTGMMADPEIYEALLVQRNTRWLDMLVAQLEDAPRPLVAVGAGHLVGPDSLGAMLEERGYTVTRLGR